MSLNYLGSEMSWSHGELETCRRHWGLQVPVDCRHRGQGSRNTNYSILQFMLHDHNMQH